MNSNLFFVFFFFKIGFWRHASCRSLTLGCQLCSRPFVSRFARSGLRKNTVYFVVWWPSGKFYTMTRHDPDLGSRLVKAPRKTTNQNNNQELKGDTSPVWNFCSRSSRGNQWWRREMSTRASCSGVYHRMCFGDQDNHMETAMIQLSECLGWLQSPRWNYSIWQTGHHDKVSIISIIPTVPNNKVTKTK